jgi:outer membrane putative beta-barrel porin/alpha-amylase
MPFRKSLTPLLLFPAISMADHTSINLSSGTASPIATESALTLPAGKWAGSLRTEYVRNKGYSDTELQNLRAEDSEADLHTSKALWSYSAGFAYGITDDLTVGFRLPFIYRNDIREPEHDYIGSDAEIENLGDVEGIGDTSIYGQYRFLQNNNTHASVILGLKAPTGKTSRKTVHHGETAILDAEFQPGSGSWDGIFGLAFTQQWDAISLDSSLVYSLSTEGTQDTDLGDIFSYNFALSYKILGQNDMSLATSPVGVDLVMEVNGEWRDKEETRGEDDHNSGGNLVFLSPGMRVRASKFASLAVSFGIPVVEDTNGNQDEPDYRIIGNVNFRF